MIVLKKSINVNKIDVNVYFDTYKNNKYVLRFNFNQNTVKKLNGEYFTICIDDEKNRVYFTKTDKDEGYKISKGRIRIITNNKRLKNLVGLYDLKFDNDLNMYYIKIERI